MQHEQPQLNREAGTDEERQEHDRDVAERIGGQISRARHAVEWLIRCLEERPDLIEGADAALAASRRYLGEIQGLRAEFQLAPQPGDDVLVERLPLSKRTLGALQKAGLSTVGDIRQAGWHDLTLLQKLGTAGRREIVEGLLQHGTDWRHHLSEEAHLTGKG